jgi:hypothetical protein
MELKVHIFFSHNNYAIELSDLRHRVTSLIIQAKLLKVEDNQARM